MFKFVAIGAGLLCFAGAPVAADSAMAAAPTYADLADLALDAPIAAHVEIRRATRLDGQAAARPGWQRYFVEADIVSLIKGREGQPARVGYLADAPAGTKLRRKDQYVVLASGVPGRPGELQLVAPDAQQPFTPATAARLRALLGEAADPAAPPAITGIGKAFHVPGAIPGESETQIFLQAADGRPISLSVLRRAGEQPRWAVALSEIVDDAAGPPEPETLLWYRLACSLPPALPRQSFDGADGGQAEAIRADYQVVKAGLGPCARTRSST
jgi:hypothetical protein